MGVILQGQRITYFLRMEAMNSDFGAWYGKLMHQKKCASFSGLRAGMRCLLTPKDTIITLRAQRLVSDAVRHRWTGIMCCVDV